MEIFKILIVTFLITLLVNSSEEQGSPAAAIGAYITLYKERKRIKLEKEKNKKNRHGETPKPRPIRNCEKFPFYYSSCSNNSPYLFYG